MPEFLTTREVADLLRIKERKVYDLAASGSIPHTKAMGKLLFPREAVNVWLARASVGGQTARSNRPNVFLGSHDPLLDWTLRESQCGIACWFDGSEDGLDRFANGEGIASGLHLFDPVATAWNVPTVSARAELGNGVLVHWASRERGLIIRPELDGQLTDIAGLAGRRLAPRQSQSGSHRLLEHLISESGISEDELDLLPACRSESDAAIAVLEGRADVTFGLETLARQYRLPFIPLVREQFDLLIDRHAWFEPPLQTFWAFCRSEAFAAHAAGLSGYDLGGLGSVRFNGRSG